MRIKIGFYCWLTIFFLKPIDSNAQNNEFEDYIQSNLSSENRITEKYSDFWGYYSKDRTQEIKNEILRSRSEFSKIDRSILNSKEKKIYDSYKWYFKLLKIEYSPEIASTVSARPINTISGIQIQISKSLKDFHSSAQPYSLQTYEYLLNGNEEYSKWLISVQGRLKDGMHNKKFMPKREINKFIDQIESLIQLPPEDSIFFPELNGIAEDEKKKLEAEFHKSFYDRVKPVTLEVIRFLKKEYLPESPNGIGLVSMNPDSIYYEYLIKKYTLQDIDASKVHMIGVKEVKRIQYEMRIILNEMKYSGSLKEFFNLYRSHPSFRYSSEEEIYSDYSKISATVDYNILKQFNFKAKSDFKISKVDESGKNGPLAYYVNTPNAMNNIVYLNVSTPKLYSKYELESIFLHEFIPGHYFQLNYYKDIFPYNRIPNYMKSHIALEGWAVYAESLGGQLGLSKSPRARFGALHTELLRAIRLVVDTGVNIKGWEWSQAVNYIIDNSGFPEEVAFAEIERYISNPGEVLSYKIGELNILNLKLEAINELGNEFDVKQFHFEIISASEFPHSVAQSTIRDWIKAKKLSQ